LVRSGLKASVESDGLLVEVCQATISEPNSIAPSGGGRKYARGAEFDSVPCFERGRK